MQRGRTYLFLSTQATYWRSLFILVPYFRTMARQTFYLLVIIIMYRESRESITLGGKLGYEVGFLINLLVSMPLEAITRKVSDVWDRVLTVLLYYSDRDLEDIFLNVCFLKEQFI